MTFTRDVVTSWNGAALQARREEQGLSRRKLTLLMHDASNGENSPAERTIVRWESHESFPDADDIAVMARVLQCSVQDFFTESEPEGAAA